MSSALAALAAIALYFGYFLVAVAFIDTAIQAWRRRDPHRLDAALFLGLFVTTILFGAGRSDALSATRLAFSRLIPWALVRLLRHFRRIPTRLVWALFFIGLGTPAIVGVLPPSMSWALRSSTSLYCALGMTLSAVILVGEAARSSGVKARRVRFAAAGSGLFAVTFLLSTASAWSQPLGLWVSQPSTFLQGIALTCFYFAFTTPRFLLSRWRRAEQSLYLAQVMDREPEERGRQAGDDLFQAAVRGVGGAVTIVALRPSPALSELVVKVSSDLSLIHGMVDNAAGLVGTVMRSSQPASGTPAEFEAQLSRVLLPDCVGVLVAPIVAGGLTWGVVIVGQRRGALFPEDDLAMLAQMSRNAATALDHAQLAADRRQHERDVAERQLREMESRVELMLDSIKDYAMLVLDGDGRVAAWHPGAEHVFGHTRAAITGQSAGPLYGLTAVQLSAWLAESRAWGHAEREGACLRADGSTFVGTTTVRPLVDESGAMPGFVVVTHDVTDRRHLEDRLRQGQKMEAIGQLAGGVAHDFNNLLTAILGYADWLDRDLSGDPRQEQVVEIQKAAERAAELTRQLLAFSRRQMLQPSAVNLSELVRDLLPMLRRLIDHSIQIADVTADALPAVLGDRSQVEQIVLNLAVNARDAMPQGGTLSIRTSEVWMDEFSSGGPPTLAPGPHVLLEVADTGTGMTADVRQRVFEPFFTTKDVGRGTGLGLSTVYGIVQQMGGEIEVDSTVGAGTRFRIWFPQTSEAGRAAAPPTTTAPGPRHGDETVLLVEDEDAVRHYLTHVLESHGYRVIPAEHPSAALSKVESFGEHIDLVISDVVMPGSTGPELVRLLERARPGLSALFISGYADSVWARSGDGVDGHQLLMKPFSSRELLTKIRQILAAA